MVAGQLNRWLSCYGEQHQEFAETWERFAPVAICLELIMIWAYALNQIVDRKKSVWDKVGGVEKTALEHDLIMSLLLQLLQESEPVLDKRYPLVVSRVQQLIISMGKGFWVEYQRLNANVTPLETILPNWESNYRLRNRLINQVYDDTPLIGYFVATGNQEIFRNHEIFFSQWLRFSEAGQVINDFSDFRPESCDVQVKSYQDAFADLRNGYITYPVYRLLETAEIKRALQEPRVTHDPGWQRAVTQQIREKGLLKEIRAMGREAWRNQLAFWEQYQGGHDPLLLGTYRLLLHNKHLRKKEGGQLPDLLD